MMIDQNGKGAKVGYLEFLIDHFGEALSVERSHGGQALNRISAVPLPH